MRRTETLFSLALAGLLMALSGCSQTDAGGGSPSLFPKLQTIAQSMQAPPSAPEYLALAQTDAPAMIVLAEHSGQFDIARQATARAGVETLMMRNGSTLSMQDGVLVASRGMGDDIMATDDRQVAALLKARRSGFAKRFVSRLDGNHHIVQTSYVCEVKNEQPFLLELSGLKIPTNYMTETCMGEAYGFANSYWVAQDGRIWQSRQFQGSLIGYLNFRTLTQAGLAAMTGKSAAAREAG